MNEDEFPKELNPDKRDWEYDGWGKKRHKKAFHLSYDDKAGDTKECGVTNSSNKDTG